jgi:SAM-dependent methyltransferase
MGNFWKPQMVRAQLIKDNLIEGDKLDITLDMGSAGMLRDDKMSLHKFLMENVHGRVLGIDKRPSECTDILADLDKPLHMFPEESISNIVAGEVIEHLTRPYEFLLECKRILKKSGRLILTTPSAEGIQLLVGRESPWHYYTWTLKNFQYLAKAADLKIIKIERINIYYNRNLILRGLGKAIPKLRPTLFIVLEKNESTYTNKSTLS